MMLTEKPLAALTAGDLMTEPVEAIPQDMSLREAAHLLCLAQISGAPVVDPNGRCVGVLSATDFVRWAEDSGPAGKDRPLAVCSDWQVVELDMLPSDEVRWYMTPDPVTVGPATPITDLARRMLDGHIHRVIVVDEERRPVGIVTSTDILAAVARAHEPIAMARARS
jgi:CBS domain-containing protein